jgi:hypothetical protein
MLAFVTNSLQYMIWIKLYECNRNLFFTNFIFLKNNSTYKLNFLFGQKMIKILNFIDFFLLLRTNKRKRKLSGF